MFVLKPLLLVDFQHKVDELVIFITSRTTIVILEHF
jgi:hypothetical protein